MGGGSGALPHGTRQEAVSPPPREVGDHACLRLLKYTFPKAACPARGLQEPGEGLHAFTHIFLSLRRGRGSLSSVGPTAPFQLCPEPLTIHVHHALHPCGHPLSRATKSHPAFPSESRPQLTPSCFSAAMHSPATRLIRTRDSPRGPRIHSSLPKLAFLQVPFVSSRAPPATQEVVSAPDRSHPSMLMSHSPHPLPPPGPQAQPACPRPLSASSVCTATFLRRAVGLPWTSGSRANYVTFPTRLLL